MSLGIIAIRICTELLMTNYHNLINANDAASMIWGALNMSLVPS